MENRKKTLGELIREEVGRQQMSVIEFAEKICCVRGNAYDLFKRGDKIDIAQLMMISKVLKRNFFQELADDYSLVDIEDPQIKKDLENRLAVSLFLENVPKVLKKLGVNATIVFPDTTGYELISTPDFGLSEIAICFTVGQRLLDKSSDPRSQVLELETFTSPRGELVDVWTNPMFYSAMIDISIVQRSEQEWEDLLTYVINNVVPEYGPMVLMGGPRIDKAEWYHERKKMHV